MRFSLRAQTMASMFLTCMFISRAGAENKQKTHARIVGAMVWGPQRRAHQPGHLLKMAGGHARTLENTPIAQGFGALPWPTCTTHTPHTNTYTHTESHTHALAHTHTHKHARTHVQTRKIYSDTNKSRALKCQCVCVCVFLAYAWGLPVFSEVVQVDALFFAGPKPWHHYFLNLCLFPAPAEPARKC